MFYSFFLFFLEAFLLVGETFTVQLTDIRLLSPLVGSTPRILETNIITTTVPEEAANSEVTCPVCFQLFYLFIFNNWFLKQISLSVTCCRIFL